MTRLATIAADVLNDVDTLKFEEADHRISQARIELLPQRKAISRAVAVLADLQSTYLEATRKKTL